MIAKLSLVVVFCNSMIFGPAYAASQVKVECWKRLSDGDVHAETSKYPQFSSGFKVMSFKSNRKDAEWSFGTCVLAPRK
ncbi:hypothetical protein FV223_01645 [Methylobacterium sp. WL116]|nr:hypothetical protein FV223_01645 [Methylobacterium sp. WL116]